MTMERISSRAIERQRANRSNESILREIQMSLDVESGIWKEAVDQFASSILRIEDVGWEPLNSSGTGYDLDKAKELSAKASKMTRENPLLKRGAAARGNNVFGRGAPVEGELAPRFQSVIDDPINQKAIFEIDAQLAGDRALFHSGMFFVAWDKKAKQFERVPLSQIKNIWYNPRRPSEVWYYLREFTYQQVGSRSGKIEDKTESVWIPVDTYKPAGGKYADKIADTKVDNNLRMIDLTVNSDGDTSFGYPDCYSAIPWAWAYAEGLRDGIKLNKALSSIAWLVKQRSAKGTVATGAKIASKQGRGAGQTVVATEGTELTSMPRSNAIDLTTLRPVASMVASALEVSTVTILSDSGAASGSNAAETTLEPSTRQAAETRQQLWASFYKRLFRVMGIPEKDLPKINFPKIDRDPTHRFIQAMTTVRENGGLSQKEYRVHSAEALDIILDDPDELPDIPSQKQGSTLPGQGQTGTVGPLADGDNELRDQNL